MSQLEALFEPVVPVDDVIGGRHGTGPAVLSELDQRPVAAGPMGWRGVVKRAIDVVVATLAIVVILPMLGLFALGVRLTSPGPVLFRQTRVGRHGEIFTILKFRTFPVGHVPPSATTNEAGAVVPVPVTPLRFGRILRRTSMDELPQLFNVLAGHMSLVGPRPERPDLAVDLARRVPGYHDRHRAPVGLTGHAQILGLCGNTSIEDRVAADNHYIESWSLRRDVGILLRTIPSLYRKFRVRDLTD